LRVTLRYAQRDPRNTLAKSLAHSVHDAKPGVVNRGNCMTMRKTTFTSLSIIAVLFVAQASAANAWTRGGGGVGPGGGTWHSTGSGSCAGGSCSSQQSFTGPAGRTYSRQGSTSCAGGTCNSSATVTGPNGGTVTRSGTISRN
jgi:hypothetical protein